MTRRSVDAKLELIGLPIGLPYERLRPVRLVNRALQARMLANAVSACPPTSAQRIYWFYDWLPAPLVHRLPRATSVMEITDSADQFFATSPAMLRQLPELRKIAAHNTDVVFVVNSGLADEIDNTDCRIEVMPNGISSSFLDQAAIAQPEPAGLSNIPHPRLCVVGTPWSLNYRVDHALLAETIERLPEWQLMLIGCDTAESQGLCSLADNARVHLIGMVPQDELVGFIQHSDVCAAPYVKGPVHRDSLKVYEYLACGRPIILTADDVAEQLRPFVKRAQNATDFAELCRNLLTAKDTSFAQQVRPILYGLTWEQRAEGCLAVVRETSISS